MISTLAAWFAARTTKLVIVAAVIAGLFCLGGLGAWRAMAKIDAMEARAAAAATAERDAHWRAVIAQSNADAERERADAATKAANADAAARDEIDRLNGVISNMEKANAILPHGGDCGLDHGRVRLLNGAR